MIKTMTAKEYRAILGQLNISQMEAGRLFQVGARTSRRWALDEVRIPTTVAMLLRLMADKELSLTATTCTEDGRPTDIERTWMFSAKTRERKAEAAEA